MAGNEFFSVNNLLTELGSDVRAYEELRANIGITQIIEDLNNETIITKSLTVTSNVFMSIPGAQSNYFLKCVDTTTGRVEWTPFSFNESISSIATGLISQLSNLDNLRIDGILQLTSNLEENSNAIIMNDGSNGEFKWVYLSSDYLSDDSNVVPSLNALSNLYQQTQVDNATLSNDLLSILNSRVGIVLTNQNLGDLENIDDALSNLGLRIGLTTSNVVASNISASNAVFNNISVIDELRVNTIRSSAGFELMDSNLSVKDVFVESNVSVGSNLFVSDTITSLSNVVTNIVASNVSSGNIQTSNLRVASNIMVDAHITTASNITASRMIAQNAEMSNVAASNMTTDVLSASNIFLLDADASNYDILQIVDNAVVFATLDSNYESSSKHTIPSSFALSNAVTVMKTTLADDPVFSSMYLQNACNLDHYSNYGLESIKTVHCNLQLKDIARTADWFDLDNIPTIIKEIAVSNIQDISINHLDAPSIITLKNTMGLATMAEQDVDNVNITGGTIDVTRLQTENFVLNSNDNTEKNRTNPDDNIFTYLRNAGDEGENVSGTGKWTNLPINQSYDAVGSNSMPSSYALSNLYTFMVRGGGDGVVDDAFLNAYFSNQSSKSNAATTKALSDLYTFMRSSNDFLNTDFSNVYSQNSHSNAATTKALYDLYAYMRNSNNEGFLVKDFSNQASHDHAATAKAVSDLYAFMRSSNDLLNTDFSNVDSQNSHSNAASTKALYDLYAYMRNSNNEGFLVKDFSNQDSHEHAATAKAVSDMFNYFTTGNMYISDDINDTDANKVVSASNFNKLYENLVLPTFFTDFNDFIFTSAYLKDINDEVTDSNPYSSEATSNLIQSMIGESSSIFNSLSTGNLIESSFNVDNSRKLASAKAVHDLSNNIYSALKTSNVSIGLIDRLSVTDSFLNVRSSENDNIELGLRFSTDDFSVKDSNTTGGETVKVLGLNQNSIDTQIGQVVTAIFQDTTQDIGLINRISTSQPFLNVSETQNANVTVGFNFDPDDFSVNTETNQFGINFANFDTNVATVAKNVIRVEVNTETGFAANVLDISSNNGVFKFQFNPSPLIDEITREATKATADAIFKYILEDYNFGCNVYFNKNIFIDSNINVSNDIHAGRDVFISNELSIHNSVYMKSNAHIALNLSVGNNAVVGGTLSLNKTAYMMSNVEISSTLEVQDDVHMRANMYVTDNAFISSNLSIGKDVFCSSNLSIGSNAYITSNLSIGKDAYVANLKALSNVRIGKYLSVADDAIFSGNVVIGCNLSVESVNMNELNFKNVFSMDTITVGHYNGSQPRITGKNIYDNNLIFSNINVVLSNDAMLEASNIIITGKATFDNVIDGFVSRITTKDKTMENSSKSYTPVLIDETDTDGVALRYCSNMTFKKNGDVIMTDNLSVGKEIRGSNLSVGSLYFTTLGSRIPVDKIDGNIGIANNINAHTLKDNELSDNSNIKFTSSCMASLSMPFSVMVTKDAPAPIAPRSRPMSASALRTHAV